MKLVYVFTEQLHEIIYHETYYPQIIFNYLVQKSENFYTISIQLYIQLQNTTMSLLFLTSFTHSTMITTATAAVVVTSSVSLI